MDDFRFHDLRHTWASWHIQSGTPSRAIQEMAGWQSSKMLERYAHLSVEHLAEHAGATHLGNIWAMDEKVVPLKRGA